VQPSEPFYIRLHWQRRTFLSTVSGCKVQEGYEIFSFLDSWGIAFLLFFSLGPPLFRGPAFAVLFAPLYSLRDSYVTSSKSESQFRGILNVSLPFFSNPSCSRASPSSILPSLLFFSSFFVVALSSDFSSPLELRGRRKRGLFVSLARQN